MVYNESLYYLLYSCTNPIFWKNLLPEDMGQNVLDQSDCRVFKSTISLEHIDEKAWLFCIFMQIHGNWKLIEKYSVGRSPRWLWPPRSQDSKIGCIFGINGINWFLVCWYKFGKAKSYFNNYWECTVKNWRSLMKITGLLNQVYLTND